MFAKKRTHYSTPRPFVWCPGAYSTSSRVAELLGKCTGTLSRSGLGTPADPIRYTLLVSSGNIADPGCAIAQLNIAIRTALSHAGGTRGIHCAGGTTGGQSERGGGAMGRASGGATVGGAGRVADAAASAAAAQAAEGERGGAAERFAADIESRRAREAAAACGRCAAVGARA